MHRLSTEIEKFLLHPFILLIRMNGEHSKSVGRRPRNMYGKRTAQTLSVLSKLYLLALSEICAVIASKVN